MEHDRLEIIARRIGRLPQNLFRVLKGNRRFDVYIIISPAIPFHACGSGSINKPMDPLEGALLSCQLSLVVGQLLRLSGRCAQLLLIPSVPLVGPQKKMGRQEKKDRKRYRDDVRS
jgi:hypothetical protein